MQSFIQLRGNQTVNKAIEISKYIVNYANEKGLDITNLKLQKLLYYVQAAFLLLSEGKEPCFSDKIVAWLHGPVVENVYYEYSKYRGEHIPKQESVRKIVYKNGKFDFDDIPFYADDIPEKDRIIIDRVLDGLLKYDAWELVRRTHEEQPWIQVKETNGEIGRDSIYSYFKEAGRGERIYGDFTEG